MHFVQLHCRSAHAHTRAQVYYTREWHTNQMQICTVLSQIDWFGSLFDSITISPNTCTHDALAAYIFAFWCRTQWSLWFYCLLFLLMWFKESIREMIQRFKIAKIKWKGEEKKEMRNFVSKWFCFFLCFSFCKWVTPILIASNKIHTKCAYCVQWLICHCLKRIEWMYIAVYTCSFVVVAFLLSFELTIRNRKNLAFVSIWKFMFWNSKWWRKYE